MSVTWDDDISPPTFSNLHYVLSGGRYTLYATITDPSGVNSGSVKFAYRVPGASDFVNVTTGIQQNGNVWSCVINSSTPTAYDCSIEWRVYAADLDSDRAGDASSGWSGAMSIELPRPLAQATPYSSVLSLPNSMALYTTFFEVGQDGIYSIELLHTAAIYNASMWVDGYKVYDGVQLYLSSATSHTITVYVESVDSGAAWAVRLMNMKNARTYQNGTIAFNTFVPAPSPQAMLMQFAGLVGISIKQEVPSSFVATGIANGGSFESTSLSPWTTNPTYPATLDTSQHYDGAKSVKLVGSGHATYIELILSVPILVTQVSFFYKRIGTGSQDHRVTATLVGGATVAENFSCADTGGWVQYVIDISTTAKLSKIRIETLNSEAGTNATYVDYVVLVRSYAAAAQWSNPMRTNLGVKYVIDQDLGSGWQANLTYAAHTDFIVSKTSDALLAITIDAGHRRHRHDGL